MGTAFHGCSGLERPSRKSWTRSKKLENIEKEESDLQNLNFYSLGVRSHKIYKKKSKSEKGIVKWDKIDIRGVSVRFFST